jgi:hypothetical protein
VTVYHATLPSDRLAVGIDVLTDAVLHSVFDPEEIAREIEVVLEEIRRGEDSPFQVLGNAVFEHAFQMHPYRAPILGTPASVAAFERARVQGFFERWYARSAHAGGPEISIAACWRVCAKRSPTACTLARTRAEPTQRGLAASVSRAIRAREPRARSAGALDHLTRRSSTCWLSCSAVASSRLWRGKGARRLPIASTIRSRL